MARHGEILCLGESHYIGRNYYMFLSCKVPKGGDGGPVIDHDGNVTGMAFHLSPNPAVLSIFTIITCIEMWLKFRRIARPIHGLGVRTMQLMDVSLHEEMSLGFDINSGYIVDEVSYDSAAESVGIYLEM
uniref:Peptidase S1 domain-containing protein n=1 Tax=Arundo donax TaxID=35708 RepID=A0A0A9B9J2_ARUDO